VCGISLKAKGTNVDLYQVYTSRESQIELYDYFFFGGGNYIVQNYYLVSAVDLALIKISNFI
jgi:hypothetical protein